MKPSKVIVRLKGGLGNQMFQYAYGRKLSLENKAVLKLDKSLLEWPICQRLAGITARRYELGEFNINERFAGFWETVLKPKGSLYLDGYWQNEEYFKGIRDILLEDFRLKKKTKNFLKLEKLVCKANSVSIHFRREDYIKKAVTRKYHGTLGLDYYRKAIEIIGEKVKNPSFFVFSDDILWVKKNFKKVKEQTVYVSGLCKLTNPEELILMSLCKHNIIANSSFSWWGAWLNKNRRKIVLAPKKWFRAIGTNPGVVPQEWIKLS